MEDVMEALIKTISSLRPGETVPVCSGSWCIVFPQYCE